MQEKNCHRIKSHKITDYNLWLVIEKTEHWPSSDVETECTSQLVIIWQLFLSRYFLTWFFQSRISNQQLTNSLMWKLSDIFYSEYNCKNDISKELQFTIMINIWHLIHIILWAPSDSQPLWPAKKLQRVISVSRTNYWLFVT